MKNLFWCVVMCVVLSGCGSVDDATVSVGNDNPLSGSVQDVYQDSTSSDSMANYQLSDEDIINFGPYGYGSGDTLQIDYQSTQSIVGVVTPAIDDSVACVGCSSYTLLLAKTSLGGWVSLYQGNSGEISARLLAMYDVSCDDADVAGLICYDETGTYLSHIDFADNLYRNIDDGHIYYRECKYGSDSCEERRISDVIFDEYLGGVYFRSGDDVYVHRQINPVIGGEMGLVGAVSEMSGFVVYNNDRYAYDDSKVYMDGYVVPGIDAPLDQVVIADPYVRLNDVWVYQDNSLGAHEGFVVFDDLSADSYVVSGSLIYDPSVGHGYHVFGDDTITVIEDLDIVRRALLEDHMMPTEGEDGSYIYYSDGNHTYRYMYDDFAGLLQSIVIVE